MKRVSSVFLKFIIISYALILTYCNSSNVSLTRSEAKEVMVQKYGGLILSDVKYPFSNETIKSLLQTNVILDTVVFAAGTNNERYYLKAFVNSDSDANYYAYLFCTKNIYEKYLGSVLTTFVIAASITKIERPQTTLHLETVEGELLAYSSNNELLLTGECLEIIDYKIPNQYL